MRKEQLDNWVKIGGDLPRNLTDNEKSYLEGLGWSYSEEWYENGQKDFEFNSLNGKLHGVYKAWHKNGQKNCEKNYRHEKEHGVQKTWCYDGTLYSHEEYAYGVFLKDFLK